MALSAIETDVAGGREGGGQRTSTHGRARRAADIECRRGAHVHCPAPTALIDRRNTHTSDCRRAARRAKRRGDGSTHSPARCKVRRSPYSAGHERNPMERAMSWTEIIFEVSEVEFDGGYSASALGFGYPYAGRIRSKTSAAMSGKRWTAISTTAADHSARRGGESPRRPLGDWRHSSAVGKRLGAATVLRAWRAAGPMDGEPVAVLAQATLSDVAGFSARRPCAGRPEASRGPLERL